MDQSPVTRVVGILSPPAVDGISDLMREAMLLRDDGADVIDLDALPGGAFERVDDDTLALLVRGLSEAGIPVSVSTTSAALATVAVEHGAAWILDPSGTTADPGMLSVAASGTAGWVIGPWSDANHTLSGDAADAYTEGLVRNLAALLEVGVRSEQIVLHAGAGTSAEDPEPWRMLNNLDRVSGLGYPVLLDARDEILAAVSSDESPDRLEDAAVGLAILAAGLHVWGIRARRVGRVAGALQRMLEPRQPV